ncbi:MAG TPA: transglycosylase SLT domain-containing protein [Gemmatimonadales bacterium]|nr:transglycosylase SLT domain-containing protein [Gemmatimonadales bacterium]
MIHFTHLKGSLEGTKSSSDKRWLRLGTGHDCELRFDAGREPRVAPYHAAVVLKDGTYYLLDLDSPGGVRLNGKKVSKAELRTGDKIRLGATGGPEAQVEIVIDSNYDPAQDAAEITKVLQAAGGGAGGVRVSATGQIFALTAQRIAEERQKAGGVRSRKTMDYIATAVGEVSEAVKTHTKRRWVKVVGIVSGVALAVIAIMGIVIYAQHRQIAKLLDAKGRFDAQIHQIQQQMQSEQDSTRLALLEQRYLDATSNAERTLADLARADRAKAVEAANAGDELDREIRTILRQFDAETYAVPPIFKQRLQYHIDQLLKANIATREVYQRKMRYWPIVSREFRTLELPDVMGYVAWTESRFNPTARNPSGARGMWQMMPITARQYGLRVDGKVDDRTDVNKQTRAAARHLANLLAEFGEDAFMLAMASYNRGENGVRAVLHKIAQTPGGYKKQNRDFWHLYRMKLLPAETMEYVPKILAAAVVCSNPQRYGLEPAAR